MKKIEMKHSTMKQYTWTAYYTDNRPSKQFWCAKDQIVDLMSAREFAKLDRLEIINTASDKTKHRPVTKEELEKML